MWQDGSVFRRHAADLQALHISSNKLCAVVRLGSTLQ